MQDYIAHLLVQALVGFMTAIATALALTSVLILVRPVCRRVFKGKGSHGRNDNT